MPKDPSVEAKIKEALEKQEAAIKQLKEMSTSKLKGYAEIRHRCIKYQKQKLP